MGTGLSLTECCQKKVLYRRIYNGYGLDFNEVRTFIKKICNRRGERALEPIWKWTGANATRATWKRLSGFVHTTL